MSMILSPSGVLVSQVTQTLTEGDRRGFRSAVLELVAIDADLGRSWRSLTTPLLDYGEFDLATAAIDRYVAWSGNRSAAMFDQATVYARSGRHARARALLECVDPGTPDRVAHAFLRGTLALDLGDFAAARALLLQVLAIRPLSGQAAYALAASALMATDNEVADRILAGEPRLDDAPRAERAMYLYALGKVSADRGEIDRAFDHYARGAAIVAASRAADPASDRAGALQAIEGWNASALAAVSARITVPTGRPIVVTGLPRSGTTLVEQVFASHSAVGEGDELGYFAMLVNEIGGPMAGRARRLAERARPNEVVGDYLHLLDNRFGRDGRVVDKTLEATRYLGTFAALLPDAPILYVRRRPLARAWSCFSTYFMTGLGWTFDQRAIAAHFRIEEALLERWHSILGDRLMIVDYETLVSDKETEIPRLLGHAGLVVEPQTLTPETAARLVRTASVAQVRAPIGTGRVDAVEAYRQHLQPFIEAYTAAGGTID